MRSVWGCLAFKYVHTFAVCLFHPDSGDLWACWGGVGGRESREGHLAMLGSLQLTNFLPASAIPCNLFYSSAVLDGERVGFMVMVDLWINCNTICSQADLAKQDPFC